MMPEKLPGGGGSALGTDGSMSGQGAVPPAQPRPCGHALVCVAVLAFLMLVLP